MISQQEECAVFEQAEPVVEEDQQVQRQPRYHVILWDDEDHTYEYVIRMLRSLFGHPVEKGYELASQVDRSGQVICTPCGCSSSGCFPEERLRKSTNES